MAEGHNILSSSISNLEPSSCQAELTVNGKYDKSIIEKNLKLAWTGDFDSMKCLVAEYLELEGVWKSVGSDKKVFYSDNSECISWRKNQKLIQIKGSNSEVLKRKLLSAFLPTSVTRNTDMGIDTSSANLPEQKSYLNHCNCNSKELSADIEGIKLDMVILESRLDRNINQNIREIEQVKAVVNAVQSNDETGPQLLTPRESLNHTANAIKIPDGDIEVHNYTIPTNGNEEKNSYVNFNTSGRLNEGTKEVLTIKEKTKGTEPSFEDQRNEYIRCHKHIYKSKIKSKPSNTKPSFVEQQHEYICKHKREFTEKNSSLNLNHRSNIRYETRNYNARNHKSHSPHDKILEFPVKRTPQPVTVVERNKRTTRQNPGMRNFLNVRKTRHMKQSQTKRNLGSKSVGDQEKSWREHLRLVRQVTANTTSQHVGKHQLETAISPLIPSYTRNIHPHVHSQQLIKNQFPFQPTVYPPPLMSVPSRPPII